MVACKSQLEKPCGAASRCSDADAAAKQNRSVDPCLLSPSSEMNVEPGLVMTTDKYNMTYYLKQHRASPRPGGFLFGLKARCIIAALG
jgi:hypothetical protein